VRILAACVLQAIAERIAHTYCSRPEKLCGSVSRQRIRACSGLHSLSACSHLGPQRPELIED